MISGIYQVGSIYGIFTYIYHKNQLNIGKSTVPMDPSWVCSTWSSCRYFSPKTLGSVANLHEVVGVHDLNNPTNYQNVPALGGNGWMLGGSFQWM